MGILDIFRASTTGVKTPVAIAAAMDAQGMNQDGYLGPGRPLNPVSGYSRAARAMDFPVGVNLAVQNRSNWGRTSFDVIRELINSYDVARACINHKVDEIRSMEPLYTPMDGAEGDTKVAVEAARKALMYPDREHTYEEWLAIWLNDQLSFDAGVLKRRRNRAGEVIGLEVIDGTTIFPLIDDNGRRPNAPAPAYQQIIKGQVYGQFTAEDIEYIRFRPVANNPFGLAPIESVMLTANTNLRYQWHLLQMFTEGSIPGGFMEVPPDVSNPDQVAEWQDYWDATFGGDQSIVHKLVAVPSGSNFVGTAPAAFDPAFPDYLARQMAMAYGVVPQDLGLTADVNRATGETQTDVQFRVNTLPWVNLVNSVLTRYVQKDLGLPVQVRLNTGRDKEDRLAEANVWKIAIESAIVSADEAREELFGLPADPINPVPRGFVSSREGFIPLRSTLAVAGPIDPETKAPDSSVPLDTTPFAGTPGVSTAKLPGQPAFTRAPIDPEEANFPGLEHEVAGTGTVDPAAVTKEVAKWRASARNRIKRGMPVRKFASDVIPGHLIESVWVDLQKSTTVEDVDAAFAKGVDADPKAPTSTGTPSWRDTPPVLAPQHAVDLKLVDHWTPKVAQALTELWSVVDFDAAASAADGLGDAALGVYRAAARAVLLDRVKPDVLETVLRSLWADAYNVGTMAAQVQLGNIPVGWADWKPGFADPSQVTGKLAGLLDDAGITVKGITGTTMDRLATTIEQGVAAGDSVDGITASLGDVVSARAEMIAQTESARLLTNAAFTQYRDMGIKKWDLITSAGACAELCLKAEARNPHNYGDGDEPPLHPYCRCAASPHIEGNTP